MLESVEEMVAEVDAAAAPDVRTQIQFLHWAIEDTQRTIQFLDTKAAFCVTLMSGMVAVSLPQLPRMPHVDHMLFPVFLLSVATALLICLRVIFPTARPHGAGGGEPARVKFYIGPSMGNRGLKNTMINPRHNIVGETHVSHFEKLKVSGDLDILSSMAETAVMISYIRQLKADRLHNAMYCVGFAIVMFAVMSLVAF